MSEEVVVSVFAVLFFITLIVSVALVEGRRPLGWKLFHKKYFVDLKNRVLKLNFSIVPIEEINPIELKINEAYFTVMNLCRKTGKTKHYSLTNTFSLLDVYTDKDQRFVFALVAQTFHTSEGASPVQKLLFLDKGPWLKLDEFYYSNGSTADTHYHSELIPLPVKSVFEKLAQFYPYDTTVVGAEDVVVFTVPFKVEERSVDIINYFLQDGMNTLLK